MKPDVADSLSRLVTWVRKDALPMWLERGLNVPGDWFSTRLSLKGEPISGEEIQLISQAQMIYIICRAEQIGWLAGRRKVVRKSVDFAGRHGTLPCRSDGYVRSLQPSLVILDSCLDPIDHAWFVLANTACFAAYSEALDLRRTHNILDWLKIYFANGVAWLGVDQKTLGPPDLHRLMLIAFLSLAEVTDKPVWRQRAKDLFHYCSQQFFPLISSDDFSSGTDGVSLAERFAWVRTLCHYEHQFHPGLAFAERLYQQALLEISRSKSSADVSCLVLAEAVGAGLTLCEAGKKHEDSILPCLQRLLDDCVSRGTPGMFADVPSSPDATGSVATLLSLFEAAVVASRILSRK